MVNEPEFDMKNTANDAMFVYSLWTAEPLSVSVPRWSREQWLCVLIGAVHLCVCVCVCTVCELQNPSMSTFLAGLESSGWMRHIKSIIDASVFVAKVLFLHSPRCSPETYWLPKQTNVL